MNSETNTRAETVALCGAFLQLIVGAVLFALSFGTDEKSLFQTVAIQNAVGFFFFLTAWMHLRLRRLATAEKLDREQIENTRRAQGLVSLFTEDDVPPAARSLRQMNNYLAPTISVVLALLLAVPLLYLFSIGTDFPRSLFDDLPLRMSAIYGILPLLAAFLVFIAGTYAAGLARIATWRYLRAGAGYALASAFFLALLGAAVLLGFKITFYPARVVMLLAALWSALQAFEIIINVILDHYRPRLPDVEPRAAYDSRLSGLFAEPEGVFKTFSHTLDYQFGFRVSETWFFRFVEKSLAPLILVMILTLYLMSCFVMVAPGQAAVVERLGVPRGLRNYDLTNVDWDAFAAAHPPLKNGLHLKYPWPFERVLVVAQDRPTLLEFGHDAAAEKKPAAAPADDGHGHASESPEPTVNDPNKVANWDAEHEATEREYLMPLPDRERSIATIANGPDVMLLAGEFLVEYRIDNDADVYRFLYNYRDSEAMLRVLVERELSVCLAGEDFWQVLSQASESNVRQKIYDRIVAAIKREGLGLVVTNFGIANVHPPAGETGKAFLEVTASVQKKATEINSGVISATGILGMAPAEAEEIINDAEAYKHRRLALAKADSDWFVNQLRADAAAPEIFRMEKQMRMLENALATAQKVLLPSTATMIMDDSKAADPDSINSIMARSLEKLNSN